MRWLWSEACKERVGGYYIVGKNEREIQPEIQFAWNVEMISYIYHDFWFVECN